MTRHAEPGNRSPWPTCALAVAAVLLFAGHCDARCGSHVQIANEPAHCTPGTPCHVPTGPVAPCHGPTCSQSPEGAPVAPTVAPPTLARDAALSPSFAAPPAPSRFQRPADSNIQATHRDPPPEPPPRANRPR